MDKNVYGHQPSDADRGLDRRSLPSQPRDGPPERLPPAMLQREGGCQRARWDLERLEGEIRDVESEERRTMELLDWVQRQPAGSERRERDIRLLRLEIAQFRAREEALRARLPELRAAVARECREPEVGRREPPGRGAQK